MGACHHHKDKKAVGKGGHIIEQKVEEIKTVKANLPPTSNITTSGNVHTGTAQVTQTNVLKENVVTGVDNIQTGVISLQKEVATSANPTLEVDVSGGLAIADDMRKAYSEMCQILGSPKYDASPFEIITFNKLTNNLAYQLYQDPALSFLGDFNEFSAYCNGANKFYISGSDKKIDNENYFSAFIEIDMTNLNQPDHIKKLPNLHTGRGWHSMIFVPPRYVFIVGGMNTKSVELYDTETGHITQDSNLNENRSEASLCVVNNSHLYAFCGFLLNHNYLSTIEKCNLRSKKRTWEIVNLFTNDGCIFEPSFFSIVFGKGNSIILLGGNESSTSQASMKNYLFECKDGQDTVDNLKILSAEDNYLCSEKFFIPTNEKTSILMPVYSSDVVKVLLYDSEFNSLSAMKFEMIDASVDNINLNLPANQEIQ